MLTFGEGFHARHHDDARCARHAGESRLDLGYLCICVLERLGLVWNVAHPVPEMPWSDPKANAKAS